MGCDIHMYLQTRKSETKPWKLGKYIDLGRDYELFDLLANVRGNRYKPISESVREDYYTYNKVWSPGGYESELTVPTDFGPNPYLEKEDVYLGDHSFRILTIDNIIKYKYYYKVEEEYSLEKIGEILMTMLKATKSRKNIRCIMGFDS